MSHHGPLPATALEEALAIAGMGCWHWPHGSVRPLLSASFSALLGYPHEALPQTPGQWLNLAHPDERRPFADLLEQLGQGLRRGRGVRATTAAVDGTPGQTGVGQRLAPVARRALEPDQRLRGRSRRQAPV